MVEHVVARSLASKANRVVVATDHEGIAEASSRAGAEVCMTASHHQSGTARLVEAAGCLGLSDDEIIINVQGDEPLMPPTLIDRVALFLASSNCNVATAAVPISDIRDASDPSVVKTVLGRDGTALYFSRAAIPWDRDGAATKGLAPNGIMLKHLGIYAYRAGFLRQYGSWEPTVLEQVESLEQLRILWYGYKIAVCVVEADTGISIDTFPDLERARQLDKSYFEI